MKIKKILIGLSCILMLIGCGTDATSAKENYQNITPNIVQIENSYRASYFYLLDKNTGVVYLQYSDGYAAGMTVMLNTDGTPVTAEQLGIEY